MFLVRVSWVDYTTRESFWKLRHPIYHQTRTVSYAVGPRPTPETTTALRVTTTMDALTHHHSKTEDSFALTPAVQLFPISVAIGPV